MLRFVSPLLYRYLQVACLLLVCVGHTQARADSILIMGDSISAAYGMSLQQGWVALMAEQLKTTHPQVNVVNASISGETTSGALARLPALLAEHQPGIVVIELGGNDGLRGYPPKKFRENLANMTQLSQDIGAQVILVTMEIPPNYGPRYTRDFRESFTRVSESHDARLAPFLLEGVATEPTLMQADGIHPTVEAQPQLVANFLPTLLDVLDQ